MNVYFFPQLPPELSLKIYKVIRSDFNWKRFKVWRGVKPIRANELVERFQCLTVPYIAKFETEANIKQKIITLLKFENKTKFYSEIFTFRNRRFETYDGVTYKEIDRHGDPIFEERLPVTVIENYDEDGSYVEGLEQ